MGRWAGLVVTVTRPGASEHGRPPNKPPRRHVDGPPPAIQVIYRPRCPNCRSVDVISHRVDGNLRHYACRAGCCTPDGEPLRFKVKVV